MSKPSEHPLPLLLFFSPLYHMRNYKYIKIIKNMELFFLIDMVEFQYIVSANSAI